TRRFVDFTRGWRACRSRYRPARPARAASLRAGFPSLRRGDEVMPMMRGRITIRREPGSGSPGDPLRPHPPRSPVIEPWVIETQPDTTLAKLEAAYLAALDCVDQVEDRRVSAVKSGRFTPEGVVADALAFAASTSAPKLRRARQVVEVAKQEAAER